MKVTLGVLPQELVLNVVDFLSYVDVLNLRATSRDFHARLGNRRRRIRSVHIDLTRSHLTRPICEQNLGYEDGVNFYKLALNDKSVLRDIERLSVVVDREVYAGFIKIKPQMKLMTLYDGWEKKVNQESLAALWNIILRVMVPEYCSNLAYVGISDPQIVCPKIVRRMVEALDRTRVQVAVCCTSGYLQMPAKKALSFENLTLLARTEVITVPHYVNKSAVKRLTVETFEAVHVFKYIQAKLPHIVELNIKASNYAEHPLSRIPMTVHTLTVLISKMRGRDQPNDFPIDPEPEKLFPQIKTLKLDDAESFVPLSKFPNLQTLICSESVSIEALAGEAPNLQELRCGASCLEQELTDEHPNVQHKNIRSVTLVSPEFTADKLNLVIKAFPSLCILFCRVIECEYTQIPEPKIFRALDLAGCRSLSQVIVHCRSMASEAFTVCSGSSMDEDDLEVMAQRLKLDREDGSLEYSYCVKIFNKHDFCTEMGVGDDSHYMARFRPAWQAPW